MVSTCRKFFIPLCLATILASNTQAQPIRQLPGSRPFLAGMLPQSPPNSRVRPAASQVGLESTDFYIKKGYPKQLGDAVEAGAAGGNVGGGLAGGAAGNTGNTGVQSAGSGGFQGNAGTQIGAGSLFGGSFLGGGGGQAGFGNMGSNGFTGGGLVGLSPKGFGFGGTP